MRPIIGITPLYNNETKDFWMYTGYLDAVAQAGGIPIVLPLTEDIEIIHKLIETCDGFLFTGGDDINPIMYDYKRRELCAAQMPIRDRFEKLLFESLESTTKPILGICRGMQFLNVICGGTLYGDLPTQFGTEVSHRMEKPYDRPCHEISIYTQSPLYKLLGKKEISVNSCHHQGIYELSPTFDPMAFSKDGLIEAIYMPGMRFMEGYQWHPEMDPENPVSKKIMASFIKACKENETIRR